MGYRPGLLLERLRADFAGLDFHRLEESSAEVMTPAGARLRMHECLETHFLMHIVTAEFACDLPGAASGAARIAIMHRGALRRSGIEYRVAEPADRETRVLASRLAADAALAEALLPLDFTRCTLEPHAGHWQLRLTHFAACEVVGRLPGLRRYVRLASPQRAALLGSVEALRRVLAAHDRECGNGPFQSSPKLAASSSMSKH